MILLNALNATRKLVMWNMYDMAVYAAIVGIKTTLRSQNNSRKKSSKLGYITENNIKSQYDDNRKYYFRP